MFPRRCESKDMRGPLYLDSAGNCALKLNFFLISCPDSTISMIGRWGFSAHVSRTCLQSYGV